MSRDVDLQVIVKRFLVATDAKYIEQILKAMFKLVFAKMTQPNSSGNVCYLGHFFIAFKKFLKIIAITPFYLFFDLLLKKNQVNLYLLNCIIKLQFHDKKAKLKPYELYRALSVALLEWKERKF